MGEYRFSGHAVWDIKYHLIWITKYQDTARRSSGACPRRDPANLRGAGSQHHPGSDFTGPRAHAGGRSAPVGTGETGAIREGPVVAPIAGGVSEPAQTILGATPVGARIFLRDGGRGG